MHDETTIAGATTVADMIDVYNYIRDMKEMHDVDVTIDDETGGE